MSEIIESPEKDDVSGYITDDDGKSITIKGVYVNNIALEVDCNGNGHLGEKVDKGVSNGLLVSKKDMNRFCTMWLALYDPEILKYE